MRKRDTILSVHCIVNLSFMQHIFFSFLDLFISSLSSDALSCRFVLIKETMQITANKW